MSYSFDSSALIGLWKDHYPPDVFESVWRQMDAIAASGRLLAIDVVPRELEKKEDGIHKWVKARSGLIVPLTVEIQKRAAMIVNEFPSLTDTKSMMRGEGDPFVIALAQERGLVVVSKENSKPSKPKIPDVCKSLGVECIGLVDFFRREKWRV